VSFAALREARLEQLADLIDSHADTSALLRLIENGPATVPFIPPGAPSEG
jgi:adenosylcobyric acid synthase